MKKADKKTSDTGENEKHHEKGGIPAKKWETMKTWGTSKTCKNMGYQQKHGIPSFLPFYFTCKFQQEDGIIRKIWDSRKNMGCQEKHRKNMEYQQKDQFLQKVAGGPIDMKSGFHGSLKE
jgi:hypothetical protein